MNDHTATDTPPPAPAVGARLEPGVGRPEPERTTAGLGLIHISWAGPERWLSAGGKQWVFEDHRYCGPIVLCNKTREPAKNEPAERHPFWQHVNAWYQQGKRTPEVTGARDERPGARRPVARPVD